MNFIKRYFVNKRIKKDAFILNLFNRNRTEIFSLQDLQALTNLKYQYIIDALRRFMNAGIIINSWTEMGTGKQYFQVKMIHEDIVYEHTDYTINFSKEQS